MGPSKSPPCRPPPDRTVQNKFGGVPSRGCFAQLFPLYRPLLQDPDAPVSWQVGTTVAALAERVDALPVDDATKEVLEALQNGTE